MLSFYWGKDLPAISARQVFRMRLTRISVFVYASQNKYFFYPTTIILLDPKGFWTYKMEFDGDFELYTLNRNTGTVFTQNLSGKMVCFFGEPQIWFKIKGSLSMGSKIFLYYHVINTENLFEAYPTLAARIKF